MRPITVDDAEEVFEWTGDERVNTYMPYNTHRTPDDSRQWLMSLDTLENEYQWGYMRKSDGKLIGSGGIRFRTDEQRWSFGYNIRYDCWNQGYTTEAALRMMQYVREKHGAKRFVAVHQDGNAASGRVIMKCGLHLVGDCKYNKFDGTPVFGKEYELNEGE